MRVEARLFEILTGFFVLAAIVYGGLTAVFETGGLEWALSLI
ncbi:MAG: cytochrome c oxidase subunit 4, partial [Mycobacterium sp.]|nr:cytochrome c oxidase subunit 4 [Mycobacterium sp.]